jgi:hypothetical protein
MAVSDNVTGPWDERNSDSSLHKSLGLLHILGAWLGISICTAIPFTQVMG